MEAGLTPSMVILKEDFGFDTVANRRQAVELVELSPAARVLDVGTGSGWMAFALAQAGHFVTSVDIDTGTLMRSGIRAKEIGEDVSRRIDFLRADALDLPFSNDTFAAVFSFDTMHHFPDCYRAIDEMIRVCHPDGAVVVADLNVRGLTAVRNVMARSGEVHEENQCRVDLVGHILATVPGQLVRYDEDCVTFFVLNKFTRERVEGVVTESRDVCRPEGVPLESCETIRGDLSLPED